MLRGPRAGAGAWRTNYAGRWGVVFDEDQPPVRTGHVALNLTATLRLAVNLFKRDKSCRRNIEGKRLRAAMEPDYFTRFLTN